MKKSRYKPLVGGDFTKGHRTPRTEFLGADAYLGTKAELSAVGETGGGVHVYTGGIYLRLELRGSKRVLGDDALAVATAIGADVLDGGFERWDGADGHHVVHELGAETVGSGMAQQFFGVFATKGIEGLVVGIDDHVADDERSTEFTEVAEA